MPRLAGAHQLGDGRFVCNRSSNPVGVGVETLLRHGCVRTCVELTPHTPGRAPCSMVALFDNEEVGSSSMMGAASSMMSEVCLCYVLPAISLRAHAHTLLGAGHCPHLYHRLLGVVGHQEEHAGAAAFSFLNAPARYSRARVCVYMWLRDTRCRRTWRTGSIRTTRRSTRTSIARSCTRVS